MGTCNHELVYLLVSGYIYSWVVTFAHEWVHVFMGACVLLTSVCIDSWVGAFTDEWVHLLIRGYIYP